MSLLKKKTANKPTPATKKTSAPKRRASIFSAVDDADDKSKRGTRITPGSYVLELLAFRSGPSQKNPGVNYFAAEWTVIESEGEMALPEGEMAAWACNLV